MNATIEQVRDGLKIIVDHPDSDSLAIIEVRHRHGSIAVRSGLRGNYDVRQRPIQWVCHSLRAPLVDAALRAVHKARYFRERPEPCRGDCCPENQR